MNAALSSAVAVAVLLLAPAAGAEREPTTQTSIGIFYQPGAPETASLWREGDRGERLELQGRVLDRAGRPVAGALVELWHADTDGGVDETRYRSAQRTDEAGRFALRTVLPGHIEMARYNSIFAPRHIHVVVTHPAHPRLVSMIFFQGDERLDASPYPELAIPLERARGRIASGRDGGGRAGERDGEGRGGGRDGERRAGGRDVEVLVGGVELVLGAQPLPADAWRTLD